MDTILQTAKSFYLLKLKQKLPNFKRYIYNDLKNSTAKLTAIYGSRGVGKTTILMQLLKENPLPKDKKLYISCDYPIFEGVSLFEFVQEFSQKGGEAIYIDEIHEAKDFEKELKLIYDLLDIKLYFSGSSAIALTNPDFSRRYSMYHLKPLSFREYLALSNNLELTSYSLEEILAKHETIVYDLMEKFTNIKVLKEFNDFLKVGVYPFYFEDKNRYIDRINDTIDKVLYIDLAKIYSILPDKIDTLKRLLGVLCVSKPFEYSVEKLAKNVGITKSTLYKYFQYLHKAELITIVTNEAKRFANIKKPDKLYLANANLLNAICINSDKETIRETFLVSSFEKKHSIYYSNRGDFLVDEKYTFEIGGKNKGFKQIQDIPNSYVVADDIEIGSVNKIPLWLFGFLY